MMTTQTRRKPTSDQIFGDNKAPILTVLAADFADLQQEIKAAVEKAKALDKTVKTDEEQAALGKAILDLRKLWKKADGIRAVEKEPILTAERELDGWFKDMLADCVETGKDLQEKADAYVRQKAAEERKRKADEAEAARKKADEERQKAETAKTSAGSARAEGRAEALDAKADAAEAAASSSEADLVRARVGGVTTSAKGAWIATITDYSACIAPLSTLGMFLKREAVESALNSLAKIQKQNATWPGVTFSQDVKATFRA